MSAPDDELHGLLAELDRFGAERIALEPLDEPQLTSLLEGIAPSIADPSANISGFHLYLFNAVEVTETWRRAKLLTLDADG